MHPGFRYHLASLMAVFLSLVLGILIGGVLYQDSGLVEEQGLIIAEMEARFGDLRADLVFLQKQLDLSQRGWSLIRDLLIKDRLVGKSVFFLHAEERWDWNALEKALSVAGAESPRITAEDLPEFSPDQGSLLVKLGAEEPPPSLFLEMERLARAGVHLAFVRTSAEEGNYSFSFPALQIDCVDLTLGEIALVLGLAAQAEGHYGISPKAKGLFP